MGGILTRLSFGMRLFWPLVLAIVGAWFATGWYLGELKSVVAPGLGRTGVNFDHGPMQQAALWFVVACCLALPFALAMTFFNDWDRLVRRLHALDNLMRSAAASADMPSVTLAKSTPMPKDDSQTAARVKNALHGSTSWRQKFTPDGAFDAWHDRMAEAIDRNHAGDRDSAEKNAGAQRATAQSIACEVAFCRRMTIRWFVPNFAILALGSIVFSAIIALQFAALTSHYRAALPLYFDYLDSGTGKPIGTTVVGPAADAAVRRYVANEAMKAVFLDIFEALDKPDPIGDVPGLGALAWVQSPVVVEPKSTQIQPMNRVFRYAVAAFRTALTILLLPLAILSLRVLFGSIGLWWRARRFARYGTTVVTDKITPERVAA